MKQIRILLLITAILGTSMTAHAKKFLLRYDLEIGKSFKVEHVLKQEIAQEAMGQSQVITNTTSMRYLFKVLKKDSDGNFLIEGQVDGLKFKMDNDFMNMDYDSDSDEEAPVELKSIASGLNIPLKLLLSPRGEIIEILDTDKYFDMVNSGMEDGANPMSQMVTGSTSQLTSVEGLKTQFTSYFFIYPKQKIKIGYSWEEESESMQMVKFNNITESTLVEANKENATIKQAVNIEQIALTEGMEIEGMTMNYELSGRKEAGHQLDIMTGFLINVDSVTEISGVVSIESPQLPTPMSIPMTIKMTETIRQVE